MVKQISRDWKRFWHELYPPDDLRISIDDAVHLTWRFEAQVHQLVITPNTLTYDDGNSCCKFTQTWEADYLDPVQNYALVAEDFTVEIYWDKIAVLEYYEDHDDWFYPLVQDVSPLVVRQVLRALGLKSIDANLKAD